MTTLSTPTVIGHDWAVDLLARQIETGQVPHALLITGPAHVGKSTLGRYFAQRLNCTGPQKPCGQCRSCLKVVSGNHPDVRIFDQPDEAIKIEQIRDLQRDLSLSAVESPYRVALLCGFERATTSAANALLKTLEEPPPQVVLVLTAISPNLLLPTIVSRCQVLSLRPIPPAVVAEALQTRWQASAEQADLLAQLSAGRLGWAVQALADPSILEQRTQALESLLDLLHQSRANRLAFAQTASRNPRQVQELLALWLSIWRDILLLKSGSRTRPVNLDWQEQLRPVAGAVSLVQAGEVVKTVRSALKNLDYNVNSRLNLEVVLLKLPRL
ncbi:MAG: DNA polymerase III subunit delta' [Chloroflexi bacterium]|nr:MAG: DNA polymerase III subunit delta' [Chloroflexota bacterium]